MPWHFTYLALKLIKQKINTYNECYNKIIIQTFLLVELTKKKKVGYAGYQANVMKPVKKYSDYEQSHYTVNKSTKSAIIIRRPIFILAHD